MYLAGPDVQELFETLPNTGEDYEIAPEKVNEYFRPKRNIPVERHVFLQAFQQPEESMDVFVTQAKHVILVNKQTKLSAIKQLIKPGFHYDVCVSVSVIISVSKRNL